MIYTKTPVIGGYVKERFVLPDDFKDELQAADSPFETAFSEFVYYRTYSRVKPDGTQEHWADTVIRVIEGVFSIRKQHYYSNNIHWSKAKWSRYAEKMARSMYWMNWLPPGRGCWAMGTDYVYDRGAMSLYNCAYTELHADSLGKDYEWFMDSLMNGVGVGFGPIRDDLRMSQPYLPEVTVVIGDDREGWAHSLRLLINSYQGKDQAGNSIIKFDYSGIREEGVPIAGFGGTASGPKPLIALHEAVSGFCEAFINGTMDVVELKTNIANQIGCCVVAGNVRRSAEMGLAPISDPVFKNLKDYEKYDRGNIGWMSNNSVILRSTEDFEMIPEIAERVTRGEDLGYFNATNVLKGRLGHDDDGLEDDIAVGLNPCGEIPLEDKEVCNLSETLPTRCETDDDWFGSCEYASFYSSTVSLLPTHQRKTNAMIMKNRRIGVSIIDVTGWKLDKGVAGVISRMRDGYKIVREINHKYNSEAGVPDAVRCTTLKPGGTIPKIANRTPGQQYPTFRETLVRVRMAHRHSMYPLMIDSETPHELDVYDISKGTECFEFPVMQGPAKPALEATVWEQALNLVMCQAEWADNAVSNTLYFRPMWQKYTECPIIGITDLQCILGNLNCSEEKDAEILSAWEDVEEESFDNKTITINGYMKFDFKWNEEKEWVDLTTWNFDPKHEEDDIEPVLAHIAPMTKSVALLPHSNKGSYRQMPQEGISESEFDKRMEDMKPIDWSKLSGSDGQDEKFCEGDRCELGGGNEVINS